MREGRVGLLGKWLWRETRQTGPGLEKGKRVCPFPCFCLCEDQLQFFVLDSKNTFRNKVRTLLQFKVIFRGVNICLQSEYIVLERFGKLRATYHQR